MSDLSNMRILVVDDTEANIDILLDTLGDEYRVSVAMDGETALEDINGRRPDLILLDIMMPGIDGYEVCRKLKDGTDTQDIPIIFLTALTDERNEAKGLALGAVDYITKPFSAELVKARVRNQLELKLHRDHLEELVRERTKELLITQEITIESFGTLTEFRDPQTGGHIKRTQNYLKCLAESLQHLPKYSAELNKESIELMYKSAPLHDIGKVGVPDSILLKPGKLTPDEFEIMKQHTTYGRDMIMVSEKKLGKDFFLRYAKRIAYSHHERWDGAGYPQGLQGDDIPVSGRLMAIADVYDALVSRRVYKPPFPHSRAVSFILKSRGTQFDPDMVDAFENLTENFRQIALEFSDYEEERLTLAQ